MKGVQLTKMVQELELNNLTPEIDLSGIVIKTAEINRPALQLTGYLEHFANERVQIIGYVEYTYLMQLNEEERRFKYERFISSKIPCVIFSTMTRPSQDMIDLAVKYNVPTFVTERTTSSFMAEIIRSGLQSVDKGQSEAAKRIGLPTGTKLDTTVIELELKGSEMDYPLINITHVEALHLATREEINYVIETARKINQILSDFTSEIGVELVDFKLEFGRYHGQLLVADSYLVLIPTVTAIIGRLYVGVNRGQNPLEVSRLIVCTLGGVDIDIFNIQPQRDRTLP